jgi:MtN3 and saliva related transmembrane protein
MNLTLEIFGLVAGFVTSMGFVPQLIRGYRTKKLEDVSYYMPIVLAFGMAMWLIYGIFKSAIAIMIANAFGITCCFMLILMKKKYS